MPGAIMKTSHRYRPTVERLESVKLLSALPGIDVHPARDVDRPRQDSPVTIRGSVDDVTYIVYRKHTTFESRPGILSIISTNGDDVETSLSGEFRFAMDNDADNKGHMTFHTAVGKIFAQTITEGEPGERTFSYVIKGGTDSYKHASGQCTITFAENDSILSFVFS
jgi:hypothetical protein